MEDRIAALEEQVRKLNEQNAFILGQMEEIRDQLRSLNREGMRYRVDPAKYAKPGRGAKPQAGRTVPSMAQPTMPQSGPMQAQGRPMPQPAMQPQNGPMAQPMMQAQAQNGQMPQQAMQLQNGPMQAQGGPMPQQAQAQNGSMAQPTMQPGGPIPQPTMQQQPQNRPMPQPTMQPQPSMRYVPPGSPELRPGAKKDMERTIGKNVMGVAASVLIFIGIILFAILLIPNLTKELKMAGMYVFSFAMLVGGLMMMRKENLKDISIAITACGTGAVYISLFMTYIYFKAIEDMPLYVLLLFWIVAVCVLSRYNSMVFHLVGVIGTFVSMLFGVTVAHSDAGKAVFLTVYFIIGSLVFIINSIREEEGYVIDASGLILSSIALIAMFFRMEDLCPKGACVLMALYFIAFIIYSLAIRFDENSMLVSIMGSVISVELLMLCHLVNDSHTMLVVISLVMLAVISAVMRMKYEDSSASRLWQGVLLLSAVVLIFTWDNDPATMAAMCLLTAAAVLYGFLADDDFYKVSSLVLYFLYSFCVLPSGEVLGRSTGGGNPWVYSFAGLLIPVLAPVLMMVKKESYHTIYKLCFYFMGLIFVYKALICVTGELDGLPALYDSLSGDSSAWDHTGSALLERTVKMSNMCAFVIVAVINSIVSHSAFVRDEDGDEIEKGSLYSMLGMNVLLMFTGSVFMIVFKDAVGFRSVYMLTVLALLFVNLKRLTAIAHPAVGYYLGARFTAFLIAALYSLDAKGYTYSVACFVLAVIGIAVGFLVKKKQLRLYSLVLTLICVVKLVMFDMTYDNTVGHAGSFIVSGLLCFVISMIYQAADKRLGTPETPVMNMADRAPEMPAMNVADRAPEMPGMPPTENAPIQQGMNTAERGDKV